MHVSLQYVSFSSCQFSDGEVRAWCEGLKENHTLQRLDLGYNAALSDQSLSFIFAALSHHPSISTLEVNNSYYNDAAIRGMADMLKVGTRHVRKCNYHLPYFCLLILSTPLLSLYM